MKILLHKIKIEIANAKNNTFGKPHPHANASFAKRVVSAIAEYK